jgi:hypothetical protein
MVAFCEDYKLPFKKVNFKSDNVEKIHSDLVPTRELLEWRGIQC